MAKKIIWTPESVETFESVIIYLEAKWTEKEVEKFVSATYTIIELIAKNPEMYRSSGIDNVHEAFVTKHNLLIYKINRESDTIDLITFWDTRQDPKRKLK